MKANILAAAGIRQSVSIALLSLVAFTGQLTAADVSSSVLADIKQAQQSLSNTEQQISRQQQQLVSQYQTLQQQVQQLRDKTAVARRADRAV